MWAQVRGDMVPSPDGYIVFDDTVLDKNFSQQIKWVRRQYSANIYLNHRTVGLLDKFDDLTGVCQVKFELLQFFRVSIYAAKKRAFIC